MLIEEQARGVETGPGEQPAPTPVPAVSVLMPVRNCAAYLPLPLPTRLKAALRGGAIRLGLRPLHLLALRSALPFTRGRS